MAAEGLSSPQSELPQLKELLSRRLACLQVDWATRCVALAALERTEHYIARHKGTTVVTAVVMLTLQYLGCDEEIALQKSLQMSSSTRDTIRKVVKKLQHDRLFELAHSTPPNVPTAALAENIPGSNSPAGLTSVAEDFPISKWLHGTEAMASKGAASSTRPLPQPTSANVRGDGQQKRKRDSTLNCNMNNNKTDQVETRDTLPEGWERFLDETSQQYYYHHAKSGTTQWSCPNRQSSQCAKRSKRSRAPRVEVTDRLIRLFEGGRRYTLSALVRILDQPKAYLQEILRHDGVGEYRCKDHTWGLDRHLA